MGETQEPGTRNEKIHFKRRFLMDLKPEIKDDEDPIRLLNSIIQAQEDEDCFSEDETYTDSFSQSSREDDRITAAAVASVRHEQFRQTSLLNSNKPVKEERVEIETNLIIEEPKSSMRMFKCGKCVGIFSSQKSLTIHKLQRHNNSMPNNIVQQQQRSRSIGNGGRLRVPVHPAQVLPAESLMNIDNKDILNCNYCTRQFPNPSTLRVHMNTHTRERPFCCQYCNKRFFQSSHLTVHIRTHTGEKPYQCRFCKNTFNSPSNCRVHERTHMKGNEIFQCEECNIGFLHKSRLERHLRSRKHVHPGGVMPRGR